MYDKQFYLTLILTDTIVALTKCAIPFMVYYHTKQRRNCFYFAIPCILLYEIFQYFTNVGIINLGRWEVILSQTTFPFMVFLIFYCIHLKRHFVFFLTFTSLYVNAVSIIRYFFFDIRFEGIDFPIMNLLKAIATAAVSILIIQFFFKDKLIQIIEDPDTQWTSLTCFSTGLFILSRIVYNVPTPLTQRPYAFPLTILVTSLSAGFMLFFIHYAWKNMMHNKKQMQMNMQLLEHEYHTSISQASNHLYNKIMNMYEQQRALSHDEQKHLRMALGLLYQHEYEQAEIYLTGIMDNIPKPPHITYTDNPQLNLFLSYYEEQANNNGIEFSCRMESPKISNLSDFIIILGNALDNALEANLRYEGKHKSISVTCATRQFNRIAVSITNTFNGKLRQAANNNFISSKKTGTIGMGTRNIRSVVEKHNGWVHYTFNEMTFTLYLEMDTP